MTTPNYITGPAVSVEIGAGDTTIGLEAMTYSLQYGPAQLAKPRLGQEAQAATAGQGTGTFSASGHTTIENLPDLAQLQSLAGQPFAVTLTYFSGGSHTFQCVGSIGYDADATGEVEWNIDTILSGAPLYTPPV